MPSDIEDAQAKLNEFTKRFQSGLRVYPAIGNTSRAPTGEEYVEAVSGGIVPRDWHGVPRMLNVLHETADGAIAGLADVLNHYAAGASHLRPIRNQFGTVVLYWRMLPEIDIYEGKWKTYARLLISASEILYPARRAQDEIEFCFRTSNEPIRE